MKYPSSSLLSIPISHSVLTNYDRLSMILTKLTAGKYLYGLRSNHYCHVPVRDRQFQCIVIPTKQHTVMKLIKRRLVFVNSYIFLLLQRAKTYGGPRSGFLFTTVAAGSE